MSAPPISRERRFVVVSRNKGAAAHFGYPTSREKAEVEAKWDRSVNPEKKISVYELVEVS